jgi:hypothetical protein
MPREDDVRKIVAGARAKGLGDDQIRALVARYDARQATEPATPTAAAEPSTPAGGMLPTGGAFAGSLIGTLGGIPGRIAGAAAGGALGKGAELFFDEKDDTLGDSLKAMGAEGAKQGAYEAAGGAIGKGLKAVGGGLYRGGVALLPKTLKQQHPNIAATGLREGIALTKRGAAKAELAVSGSRQRADDMIAAAEAAGAPRVSSREVVRELRPVRDKLRNQAALGAPDDTPALRQRATDFIQRNRYATRNPDEAALHPFVQRSGMKLTDAQAAKREAQDLATTAYKARDKGAVINNTEALTNEAMARGLRKGIERRVPGVGDVNARTQDLMGVMQGAEHASETGHILSRLGSGGVMAGLAGFGGLGPAALGAVGGAALGTPGGLTAAGLGVRRMGSAASYSPQALRLAALLAQLAQEDGGQ